MTNLDGRDSTPSSAREAGWDVVPTFLAEALYPIVRSGGTGQQASLVRSAIDLCWKSLFGEEIQREAISELRVKLADAYPDEFDENYSWVGLTGSVQSLMFIATYALDGFLDHDDSVRGAIAQAAEIVDDSAVPVSENDLSEALQELELFHGDEPVDKARKRAWAWSKLWFKGWQKVRRPTIVTSLLQESWTYEIECPDRASRDALSLTLRGALGVWRVSVSAGNRIEVGGSIGRERLERLLAET